eukprot:TRINITY_DN4866_c0_g1_i1.p1 TRINITY_DN4866_c0_g1~~TRINITY_DN4866_c0_g1_i1.p1  ORF type:complete len:472 (+),score=155.22 TRINITY_DN4866_c0_g1_i1:263-1678(+)
MLTAADADLALSVEKIEVEVVKGPISGPFNLSLRAGCVYFETKEKEDPVIRLMNKKVVLEEVSPDVIGVSFSADETWAVKFPTADAARVWKVAFSAAMEFNPFDLTEEQREVVEYVKEDLAKEKLDHTFSDHDIIRFLRSNNFDMDATVKQMVQFVFFFKQFQVDKIKISEILPEIENEMIMIPGNRDKLGRPIIVIKGRAYNPSNTHFLNVVKGFIYALERAFEIAGPTEDVCMVADIADVGRKNVDERLEKMCMDIMKNRYPGRIGTCICVNTPWWFGAFWKLVRAWLSEDMRQNIHVLRGGVENLLPFVDPDQILEEWGGHFHYDRTSWVADRYKKEGLVPGEACPKPIENEYLKALATIPAKKAAVDAVRVGYMTKLGAIVKNWKKRFFVLTKEALFYYVDEKSSVPKGSVYLDRSMTADVTDETDKKNAFLLVTPLRTYVFVCKDAAEMKEWRDTIDGVCNTMTSA